jgi:hypothetical protein
MAARRPPPKSRLCSHDWHKRVIVAESLRPCLSRIQHREKKSDWKEPRTELQQYGLYSDILRKRDVYDQLYGKSKKNKPIVERINISKFVVSDLIINIRFCELFRGLALIPGLYRFFCILGDCQIQPVHASSGCCLVNLLWRGSCKDGALTCPCRLRHRGCLYCCPLIEMH